MTITDTGQAERDLSDAAAAVGVAEGQLATGRRGVTAAGLHKLRDTWRHAALTADGVHARADRERQAARMAGLEAVGSQVDTLARSSGPALREALQAVAAAVATVRALAGEHDAAVAELVAAARELGAEGRAPAGPRKTSAFVAVAGQSITHLRTSVAPAGSRLEQLIAAAAAGDADAAFEDAGLVTEVPEPHRADHYLRRKDGMVFTRDGALPDGWRTQIAAGELTPLTDRQIGLYLAGELA